MKKVKIAITAFVLLAIPFLMLYKHFDKELNKVSTIQTHALERLTLHKTSPNVIIEQEQKTGANMREHDILRMRKRNVTDKTITLNYDKKKEEFDLVEVSEKNNPSFFLDEGKAVMSGEYNEYRHALVGVYSEETQDFSKLKTITVASENKSQDYKVIHWGAYTNPNANTVLGLGHTIYEEMNDESRLSVVFQYGDYIIVADKVK